MELTEFLQQCVGRWFAQRTTYQLKPEKFENSKSDITVERLSSEHPEVLALCQQYKIEPPSLDGIQSSWEPSGDRQGGATILVFIPDSDDQHTGKLIQSTQTNANTGHFLLGEEALTLTINDGSASFEERLWFASPNLRLRASLLKRGNALSTTCFYSEIRKLPPKS